MEEAEDAGSTDGFESGIGPCVRARGNVVPPEPAHPYPCRGPQHSISL
jgi:hypothetical protein